MESLKIKFLVTGYGSFENVEENPTESLVEAMNEEGWSQR